MGLIRLLLILVVVFVITDAVLSYFPQSQNNNWARKLRKFSDFLLNPLRSLFPKDIPFDVTPMILVLAVLVILQIEAIVHILAIVLIVMVAADMILAYLPRWHDHSVIARYRKLIAYGLNPIRRFLPVDVPFDISPILLIILFIFIDKMW